MIIIRKKLLESQTNKVIAYHGTNSNFDEFSLAKNRSDLNKQFYGNGLFFAPTKEIAKKYAKSQRNQFIKKDLIIKELGEKYKGIPFTLFSYILQYGLEKGWDKLLSEFTNFDVLEKELNKKYPNFDLNDINDIAEYVEGYHEIDQTINIWGEIKSFPDYMRALMKKLKLKYSIPNPTIYTVELTFSNLLKTNNLNKAKQAKKQGYDAVYLYDNSVLVSNEPEYCVFDSKQVKIIKKEILY